MNKLRLVAFALAAALPATPAFSTIVMVNASSIQGANVLFNTGTQTNTTVFGNTNLGTATLQFTGSTVGGGNVISANGGQARIEGALNTSTSNPNDTLLLSAVQFALVGGGTFNNLELNLLGGTATSATFSITDNEGQVFAFNNQALGNGENFFGFQGINGESIASVAITLNGGGIGDVRQIRLDALAPIPEPGTWAMMIGGFGLVGGALRSSRRRTKAGYANA